MRPKTRMLLLAALFVLTPAAAFAQPLPPMPVPVEPSTVPPPVPPPGPPPVPQPGYAEDNWLQRQPPPPPPPIVPPAPSTGLAYPNGAPGPYSFAPTGPTFFLGLQLDLVKPVYKNKLTGNVTFPDGSTDTLNVPSTALDWTASPRLEAGIDLGNNLGEFLLAYRLLASEGTDTIATDLGDAGVKTRLNMNLIDFDYNSGNWSPAPRWDLRWTIGARIASLFYDTQLSNAFFDQSASNYFFGAGPHAGLEVERKFGVLPSFGLFVKGDAAVMVGQSEQNFRETFRDGFGNSVSAGSSQLKTQTVPVLNFQAGLSYQPANADYLRFTLGYQFEHWFSLGMNDSRGELTTQSVFLRGQFDF